jgi:hypothetical protein
MRAPILFFAAIISVCGAGLPEVAVAQSAGTGGVNEGGGPTMVFPIRPRDEPAASHAVPNLSPYYYARPPIRLRRAHPAYSYPHRLR